MHLEKAVEKVATKLPAERIKRNIPLAPYTTLHIGGPAQLLFEAESASELAEAIRSAHAERVPVTVLGEGSNVLVSDKGIAGLVIINRSQSILIEKRGDPAAPKSDRPQTSRHWQLDSTKKSIHYDFTDLDYEESALPTSRVTIESGVSLPYATNFLFEHSLTGLQWYAGIPGTIGGAIVNNIHGGTHLFDEHLESVTVLTPRGRKQTITKDKLRNAYNASRFHSSGETILSASFYFPRGDVNKAKYVASEWAKRKAIQPRRSPGCAFTNLTAEDQQRLGLPTNATGYLIEHVLKMTGYRVGDAAISQAHHNFIVNEGNATAEDFLAVMKEIQFRAEKECGVELKPEIFMLGFEGPSPSRSVPIFDGVAE